jgi:hypothetical protein
MTTNSIHIETFRPKFATQKLLLDFGMKTEYLLGGNDLQNLNNLGGTIQGNALNLKMNVISIRADLKECKLITRRNAQTNIPKGVINRFNENNTDVIRRTDKRIQQNIHYGAYKCTRSQNNAILNSEAEIPGINPGEIKNRRRNLLIISDDLVVSEV